MSRASRRRRSIEQIGEYYAETYAKADLAAEVVRQPRSANPWEAAKRAEKAAKLFAVIASEFVIDAESSAILAAFFAECGQDVWEHMARRAGTKAPSAETISHVVNLIRGAARGAS